MPASSYAWKLLLHRLNFPWTSIYISKLKSAKSIQPLPNFTETNKQQLGCIQKIITYPDGECWWRCADILQRQSLLQLLHTDDATVPQESWDAGSFEVNQCCLNCLVDIAVDEAVPNLIPGIDQKVLLSFLSRNPYPYYNIINSNLSLSVHVTL